MKKEFTYNFKLKVIALLLAITAWLYVNDRLLHNHSILFPQNIHQRS